VHTAKSLKDLPGGHDLTPRQQQLFDLVKERGEVPIPEAAAHLGLTEDDLRREFAPLRHMEKLRACKKDDIIHLPVLTSEPTDLDYAVLRRWPGETRPPWRN